MATSVAIIGGGIGGLAAALSLLRAGVDVQVYEQTRDFREIGAGIQVTPNASRILQRLGLTDESATHGIKPLALQQRRWDDGSVLRTTALAESIESACGAPYYQSHRADLLNALLSRLPAERLHLGHRLTGLTDCGDHVEAQFENGQSVKADALVGADGIHSVVRRILFGDEDPQFTGCIAYRGLVAAEHLTQLDFGAEFQVWMGPGKHFVHYLVRNRQLLNFVAVVEQKTWSRESWTEKADRRDVLTAFAGWHPQVRSIIESVDDVFVWGLFDRPPTERWSAGRVTLLGDACHPMLPFMAQGAAQAIEDGATLAGCLTKVASQDIPDALRLYESLRAPRAARVQAASRQNKTRFHYPDGPQQQQRDAQIRDAANDWFIQAIGWIYQYDAGAATAR